MKDWLSRYRPRYLRSLVYMLQSTEYNLGDYLQWYFRTRDFSRVERRQRLKKTAKARLILLTAWLIAVLELLIWLTAIMTLHGSSRWLVAVTGLVIIPYLLAFLIVIPLLLVRFLVQKPIEFVIVQRARRALADHPAIKIAVAGSFGKTSMREILKTVLSQGKRVAAPPASYNTPLGIAKFVRTLNGKEEVLVFELGEYYPGDIRKLCRLVQPDIGVITGVNEAHLKKFKKLERTTATIFELADWLERPIYINGESEQAAQAARQGHILYTRAGAGQWRVIAAASDLSGTNLTFKSGAQEIKAKSKLLGLHQVGPLAAAVDIAAKLGLEPEQIKTGLINTKPFDHRLEPKESNGIVTLDDSYNGNPSGVKAVIDFLGGLSGHRRFYITPGLVEMGSRTQAVHEAIGRRLAEAGIEKVVLIRNSVTPFIEAGLKSAGFKGELIWFDDAITAFKALPQLTVRGDIVLLQNDWPDQYA